MRPEKARSSAQTVSHSTPTLSPNFSMYLYTVWNMGITLRLANAQYVA